jgi:DNA-binding NarL/FixJ family response regulator
VLVDEHPVLRAGLARALESEHAFRVVGEAGTGREALEQVEVKRPGIVVLDVDLPDVPGLDLLPELVRKARTGARILILSTCDDAHCVEQAFDRGAHGYLLKDAAVRELLAAITALAAGNRYVYPPLGARLADVASREPTDPLNVRERAIARLLGLGHTNQEVAASMFLSVRTVETHRANLMAKLGLSARSELTRWTLEQGLLDDRSSTSSVGW